MRIIFKECTCGSTLYALKALRDELILRANHSIIPVILRDIQGEHVDLYGFILVDLTADEGVIIGPSFRGDGGGEGGAGHRSAMALFDLMGLDVHDFYPVISFNDRWGDEPFFHNLLLEGRVL